MIKTYYSIYDNLAQVYMTPVLFRNDEEAKRWFKSVVNDEKNDVIYNNPNDYELYVVGTWEDSKGEMTNLHYKLCDGRSLKNE